MKLMTALIALSICACGDSAGPDPDPITPVPKPTVWIPGADSCDKKTPNFGPVATEADRALFAYNADFPLNFQKTLQSSSNGVQTSSITFNSPVAGSVTGLLFEPVNIVGPRPGLVLMHGLPGDAAQMTGAGQLFAAFGAVVIAIDAPFNRRPGAMIQFTPVDRADQIQLIKDLQRAIDVLRSLPNVDDDRIAFFGISYGAAMGTLLVGIEKRLKTAVLQVGDGGLVSHYTDALGSFVPGTCTARVAWYKAMAPIEPIRFLPHATIPLLLQNGYLDELVSVTNAQVWQAAAPQPKTTLWYEAGHGLNFQADVDVHNWLHTHIGINPLLPPPSQP